MTDKLRLGVIFGGRSGEHEVSLMSARSVLSVLDIEKYEVIQIGITRQGEWVTGEDVLGALERGQTAALDQAVFFAQPGSHTLYALHSGQLQPVADLDIIFPVMHGTFGEDGTLQGLLEMADIAYVGAGVLGSSVGMDKGLFKEVMRANGFPVVDWVIITRGQVQTDAEAVIRTAESLGEYPLFTKPANLGSSVGITKCRNRSDLYEGLMEAAHYDRRVLIERGVPNVREIEVSVLGNDQPSASLAGEIRPDDDFYSYDAKYSSETSQLIIPADLPAGLSDTIRSLAVRAYRAIDCAGMARVDFLVDGQTNQVFIGEINTIPGFTRISMYPKLWDATGISYRDLINHLVELALERKAERDRTDRQFRRGQ